MVERNENVVETGRSMGTGPLTTLVGLVTTVLAMSFDLAENEHLHLQVEPAEVEQTGGEPADGEVSEQSATDETGGAEEGSR